MTRVFVLYEAEPDPDRYAAHAELCARVPGAIFRHGKVGPTLAGDPVAYYAEFEFADRDAFRATRGTPEFAATGADAAELGIAHSVHVVELG